MWCPDREEGLPEAETQSLPATAEPDPSQVAEANDLWERILVLCPPEHRELLRLRRAGLPLPEIATRTGLHIGSVRRMLRNLAVRFAREQQP